MNSVIPPFGTVNDVPAPRRPNRRNYGVSKDEMANDLQNFLAQKAQENPRLKRLAEKTRDPIVSITNTRIDMQAKHFENPMNSYQHDQVERFEHEPTKSVPQESTSVPSFGPVIPVPMTYSYPLPTMPFPSVFPSYNVPQMPYANPYQPPPVQQQQQPMPSLEDYAQQLRRQLESLQMTQSIPQYYQPQYQQPPPPKQPSPMPNSNRRRAPIANSFMDDNERKQVERNRKEDYMRELERQVEEKKRQKAYENALNRADDERVLRESATVNHEHHQMYQPKNSRVAYDMRNYQESQPPQQHYQQPGFLDFLGKNTYSAPQMLKPTFGDTFHRKSLISENRDPINDAEEQRKKHVQNENQDFLRRQIAEKEAEKRRREELAKLEDDKEMKRIEKEQQMLAERYNREYQEQKRKEEETKRANEQAKAEKAALEQAKKQKKEEQRKKERPPSPIEQKPVAPVQPSTYRSYSPPIPTLLKQSQDLNPISGSTGVLNNSNPLLPPELQKRHSVEKLPLMRNSAPVSMRNSARASREHLAERIEPPVTSEATKQLLDQLQIMQKELLEEQEMLKQEIDQIAQQSVKPKSRHSKTPAISNETIDIQPATIDMPVKPLSRSNSRPLTKHSIGFSDSFEVSSGLSRIERQQKLLEQQEKELEELKKNSSKMYTPLLLPSIAPRTVPLQSDSNFIQIEGLSRQIEKQGSHNTFNLSDIKNLNEQRLERLKELQGKSTKDYLTSLLNI